MAKINWQSVVASPNAPSAPSSGQRGSIDWGSITQSQLSSAAQRNAIQREQFSTRPQQTVQPLRQFVSPQSFITPQPLTRPQTLTFGPLARPRFQTPQIREPLAPQPFTPSQRVGNALKSTAQFAGQIIKNALQIPVEIGKTAVAFSPTSILNDVFNQPTPTPTPTTRFREKTQQLTIPGGSKTATKITAGVSLFADAVFFARAINAIGNALTSPQLQIKAGALSPKQLARMGIKGQGKVSAVLDTKSISPTNQIQNEVLKTISKNGWYKTGENSVLQVKNLPNGKILFREYNVSQSVLSKITGIGKTSLSTGVKAAPKTATEKILSSKKASEINIKPILDNMREQAAMQIEAKLSSTMGPETGKMVARFVRGTPTEGVTSIGVFRNKLLNNIPKGLDDASIKQAINAWSESAMQVQYDIVQNMKLPQQVLPPVIKLQPSIFPPQSLPTPPYIPQGPLSNFIESIRKSSTITAKRDKPKLTRPTKPSTGLEKTQTLDDVLKTKKIDFIKPITVREIPKGIPSKTDIPFSDVFTSLSARLERLGTPGLRILTKMKEADTVGLVNTGKATVLVDDLKLNSIPDTELIDLSRALEGVVDPKSLRKGVADAFEFFDIYNKNVAERTAQAGIQIRNSQGQLRPFTPRKNFFPHVIPTIKQLEKGKIREQALTRSVLSGNFKDKVTAQKALDSFLDIIKTEGRGVNTFYAQRLVNEGSAKTITEAKGKIIRSFRNSRQQRYGSLERQREIDFPFYDPNPARVYPRYIAQVEKRLADAQVFGPNFEKIDRILGGIKTEQDRVLAREIVKVAREATESTSKNFDSLLRLGRQVGTTRLSPLSSILNLGQNLNTLLVADTPSFLKGIAKAMTSFGRKLPIESGAIAEGSLRQIEKIAGATGGLTSRYVKGIGFTLTEKINRGVSANVGWVYTQKLVKGLLRRPNDKVLRGNIEALELNPDILIKQKGLTHNDLLRAVKVFVDKTQFRSRPIDLPLKWTASELGKSMTQFKTFAFQQGRFIKNQVLGELRQGQIGRFTRAMIILSVIFPLTGEAIADIRAYLQGKKRETKGLQRYFENFAYVGGLGLLTDSVQALKFGLESYILGPSISQLLEDIELSGDAVAGEFKERQLRQVIGQIPAIGPLLKERIVPREKKADIPSTGVGVFDEYNATQKAKEPELNISYGGESFKVRLKGEKAKNFSKDMVQTYIDASRAAQARKGFAVMTDDEKKKAYTSELRKAQNKVRDKYRNSGLDNIEFVNQEESFEKSADSPQTTLALVLEYAKGFAVDPKQTAKAMFTEEKLRKVVGNATILERKRLLYLMDQGDKTTVVDHKIPLSLGGDNSLNNLEVISVEENKRKSRVETYLLGLLRNGTIKRERAQELIRNWKKLEEILRKSKNL